MSRSTMCRSKTDVAAPSNVCEASDAAPAVFATGPSTTIGIVGGGQLARMLAMAAAALGCRTVILDPDPEAPAAQVTNAHIVAHYNDSEGLAELAAAADVVTYEFENVPDEAIDALAPIVPVRPPARALSVSQDRLVEKQFLVGAGLRTAAYVPVDSQPDLEQAVVELGGAAIIKTRRLGYDGKGQLRIAGAVPATAFEQLGSVPCIAEAIVDFTCEISVIGARSVDGATRCFEPARNDHVDAMLAQSTVPSGQPGAVVAQAVSMATQLLDSLDYVGVLGLELFVLADGSLVANEFAPRVHNSGHWTEAVCAVSQFEQHMRAVLGQPLGDPGAHSDCVMTNLVGHDVDALDGHMRDPSTRLHLYGKVEPRPGRKMGHVTRVVSR